MRVGVATIVSGRRDHLRRQAAALHALTDGAGVERYVVVAMDSEPVTVSGAQVVRAAQDGTGLALAAARNSALEALGDCDLAVMIDVDCIPGADLIARYVEGARILGSTPSLMCGPVGYLDPLTDTGPGPDAAQRRRARERVIRSFPGVGMRREPRAELFWSLSFAVAPAVHRAIGGFDEGYVGYGAEDTDYGLRAAQAGVGLWLIAGAWAYHQHHPPTPERDIANVLANARRFHARWGFWPMSDRLARWAAEGVIEWAPEGAAAATPTLRRPRRGPVPAPARQRSIADSPRGGSPSAPRA
jgi:N-acetylglucosaminyl-diphospho-decaprenol L-rhamnosyltransferase